jgi:short-subunit dehydrogenase
VDADAARTAEMVQLNVATLTALTREFLPDLVSAGIGALVNIASVAAYQPCPNMAVYGATKAFVLSFTESLWEEARGSELGVLAVCPGAMQTEFFDAAGSQSADYGTARATPQHVVRVALETLDRRFAPPSVVTNGRPLAIASKFLPRRIVVQAMGRMARPAAA